MSWFAVDDRFHQHRKVIRLRRSPYYAQAVSLWSLAGSWAAGDQQARLTGEVPEDVVYSFAVPDTDKATQVLIDVGLWRRVNRDTVAFHDWDMWNGPDAKYKRLEARRASDRERKARERDRKKDAVAGPSRDMSRDRQRDTRDGTGKRASGGWPAVTSQLLDKLDGAAS